MNAPNTTTSAKQFKRRSSRLVVDRNFQLRFAIKISLLTGSVLLLFTGFVLFFVKSNYDMLVREALIQMPDSAEVLMQEFRFLLFSVSTGLVVLIPTLFGIGLYLSKSVAGPVLALRRRLSEITNGRQGVRLRLRNGDELKSLELDFNQAIETLERQIPKKNPESRA